MASQRKRKARPDPPRFFTDRSLGDIKVPDGLRNHGWSIKSYFDLYGVSENPEDSDAPWISSATDSGMVILTKDKQIRYVSVELAAVEAAGAKVFCLANAHLTAQAMVERFNTNRSRIENAAGKRGPFIYRVYAKRIKPWWPAA